jgi:cyclic-di-GMP-binding protein
MASENSFDIVSKVDLQEVANAIQQALKELHQRYDLKDSHSNIEMEGKDAIILTSADDYKLKAVTDVFQGKLVKRGVSLKGLTYGKISPRRRPKRSSSTSRIPRRKFKHRFKVTSCA